MPNTQAIKAGRAFVEVFADNTKLKQVLRQTEGRLKNLGGSIARVGVGMAAAGASIVAPLAGAVMAASRMEETMNKFNVVFGENAATVKAWGDEFAGQVGRSKEQIASFMAGTQDLLVPIGFEPGAATQMSKDLTQLAIDLASFNNMEDADVLRDLHAALTGYGVIVSEAAVKQQLLNQGLDPAKATEQQKAMARMNIILAGTTAAQGDAMRSSGSFANQMKALKASISDAAVAIGTALLPVVTPLITGIANAIQVAAGWIQQNLGLIKVIAAVGAGVLIFGTILTTVGGVITAIGTIVGAISTVMTGFGVVMGVILSPIGLVVAAVLTLGAALAYVTGAGEKFVNWAKGKFSGMFKMPEMKAAGVDNSEAMKALEDLKKINLDAPELTAAVDDNTAATVDAADMQVTAVTGLEDTLGQAAGPDLQSSAWGTFNAAVVDRFGGRGTNDRALKAAEKTAKGVNKLVSLAEKGGLAFS